MVLMPRTRAVKDPTHPEFKHGTITGHNYGCRCDECSEARRVYNKDYYARTHSKAAGTRPEQKAVVDAIKNVPRVPSTNTVQRLRALVSIGYTPERLADLLSLGEGVTWWLLVHPPTTIRITLERRVRIIFRANWHRDLIDTPRAISRAKALAASLSWPRPLDVMDLDPRPVPTSGETA
jgi:hypothetical protein